MKWVWYSWSPLIWLGIFLFWHFPLRLVGIFLVLVMAIAGRYYPTVGWQGPCYRFEDKWMRLFETRDNGCVPEWYIGKFGLKRPLWLNIWIWSAWRNALGNDPVHQFIHPDMLDYEGNSDHPSWDGVLNFLKTGERAWHWRLLRHKERPWITGVNASFPLMLQWERDKKKGVPEEKRDRFQVWDWQFGFKRQPTEDKQMFWLNYTPWDSGMRSN